MRLWIAQCFLNRSHLLSGNDLAHKERVKPAKISFLSLTVFLTCLASPSLHAFAENQKTAPIKVILWFDTEDYLLPASDDAAKRLADLLTERKIRATFKVVGEKARTLERRGRRDVIAALKKHAIGFHSDFHSVHPTPSEYLADCGLLDGIAEFVRREGDGAADVRRIFGVKTLGCYGQPGSSWGAQAVAGLKQIGVAPSGVPCYVDEGTHVGLNEKPFWYTGALNVYHMGGNYTRMDLHDASAVEPAKKNVSAIAERLRNKDGGGLISIFYHPCEWVHQQFWDGVNFSRGANPPREQWTAPPQRTAAETDGAFQRFAEYIDHIRGIPGVSFVTAQDLPGLYPDLTRQEVTGPELKELAERIVSSGTNGLNFQVVGSKAFSVADQFELLTAALEPHIRANKRRVQISTSAILGPDQACANGQLEHLSWPQFREAVLDTQEFIQTQKRIPSRVFIGADAVAPADFLFALAWAYDQQRQNGIESLVTSTATRTGGIPLRKSLSVLPVKFVAQDTPNLFGGWIIHKEGFRAPKILEIARLQAWTLKPAIPKFLANQ